MMKWLRAHTYLLIVMVVAAVVRFWGWPEMDLHHDEISALLRTRFDSFDRLVEQGIRIDGHPGLVQWFLWIWTGAFGYEPWVVKLPFVLSGIASVWLIYEVGSLWFSRRAGWFAAVMLAVLQYGVTFSQWARPYAFGLFFLLVAMYFLLRYTALRRRSDIVVFAIFAALCGYTHYLALLQVIVFSLLIAVAKVPVRQWRWMVVGGLLAVVLWLPHLNITLHHLSLGGVGEWLQPPKADFWLQLLAYSFHYSWLLGGLIVALVLFSVINLRGQREHWVDRMILVGAWLIPFLIAFTYSHRVSALMHFGSMLFTFPFLLLLVASFVQSYHRGTVKVFGVLFLFIGAHTLFLKRDHLAMNLRTEYQDPLRYMNQVDRELHPEIRGLKTRLLVDLRSDAVQFLQDNDIADFSKVQLIEPLWDQGLLSHYLDTLTVDAVMIVTTPASRSEYITTVQWYCPGFLAGRSYHSAAANLYLRGDATTGMFLGHKASRIDLSDAEFGPVVEVEIDNSLESKYHYLRVTAEFSGKVGEAQLVYDWLSNDGRKEWRSSFLRDFRQSGTDQVAMVGTDLNDLPGFEAGGTLKAFLWNPGLEDIESEFIQVVAEQGVNRSYGLFESAQHEVSR